MAIIMKKIAAIKLSFNSKIPVNKISPKTIKRIALLLKLKYI